MNIEKPILSNQPLIQLLQQKINEFDKQGIIILDFDNLVDNIKLENFNNKLKETLKDTNNLSESQEIFKQTMEKGLLNVLFSTKKEYDLDSKFNESLSDIENQIKSISSLEDLKSFVSNFFFNLLAKRNRVFFCLQSFCLEKAKFKTSLRIYYSDEDISMLNSENLIFSLFKKLNFDLLDIDFEFKNFLLNKEDGKNKVLDLVKNTKTHFWLKKIYDKELQPSFFKILSNLSEEDLFQKHFDGLSFHESIFDDLNTLLKEDFTELLKAFKDDQRLFITLLQEHPVLFKEFIFPLVKALNIFEYYSTFYLNNFRFANFLYNSNIDYYYLLCKKGFKTNEAIFYPKLSNTLNVKSILIEEFFALYKETIFLDKKNTNSFNPKDVELICENLDKINSLLHKKYVEINSLEAKTIVKLIKLYDYFSESDSFLDVEKARWLETKVKQMLNPENLIKLNEELLN